ncbi:hypothetical protein E4U44_006175 [Claviceps purpurea]|nr:hypothetical protein E4U26_002655 [Claviceps purpurea]KAG6309939.1 hypothetical protein E4U44_006175 [Claviceps purpurea]
MAFWGETGGEPPHDPEAAHRSGDAGVTGDKGYYNRQDRATSNYWHHGGNRHAQHHHECEGHMQHPQPQHQPHQHQQYQHQHMRLNHHEIESSAAAHNLPFLVIREGSDHEHDRDRNPIHVHDHDHNYIHNHMHPHNRKHISGLRHTPSPSRSSSPTSYLPAESPGIHSLHANLSIPTLERTESGHSITSDTSAHHHHHHLSLPSDAPLLEDLQAARLVREHVSLYHRRYPDSQPERILRALISPKSRGADFPLDNEALQSIFSAANELFFASRLTRRVTWDWSHSAAAKYDNHILGTTAVRRSAQFDGLETLIVLSSPILRDTKYNRRLIISTFLHEMMHSFMFVMCGWNSKQSSGHTQGFLQIAGIIDDWAGKDCLHLREMEANLERWRGDDYTTCGGGASASASASAGAGAGITSEDNQHAQDTYNHRSMEGPSSSELSKYNDPVYLEQATGSWDKRHDTVREHEHHLLRPPLIAPQRHDPAQGDWQWYERGDVGERLQYVEEGQGQYRS